MLINGSELVAVAQGLVEYCNYRWIFSALPSTTKSQKSEHDIFCAIAVRSQLGRRRWAGRTFIL